MSEPLSLQKERVRHSVKKLEGRVSISVELFFEKEFAKAQSVFVGSFKSLKDEPVLCGFSERVKFFYPKLSSVEGEMFFVSPEEEGFCKTSLGFQEPKNSKSFDTSRLSVVFVPGQAFDYKGNRLGRGKGFYDKCLKGYEGIKVGVCSSKRFLFHSIPVGQKDVSMDWIITEKHIYKINPFYRTHHKGLREGKKK